MRDGAQEMAKTAGKVSMYGWMSSSVMTLAAEVRSRLLRGRGPRTLSPLSHDLFRFSHIDR